MELTLNIKNKNVYDSLALFLNSIGIAIVKKKKGIEKIAKKNSNLSSSPPVYGRLKGKIYTAPDFNDPIDDFKDYM